MPSCSTATFGSPPVGSPRRVLHVLDHLGAGGIQTYALNLFTHWADPDFTHAIAALHGPGVNHDRFVELGVQPRYAAQGKRSPSLLAGLRGIVREAQPDIVHVYGVPASLLCEGFRRWLGVPRLITHLQSTYADHPGQRYQDYIEPLCYRRTDRIVACSKAVTAGLRRRAPVTIIPNGIDFDRFSTRPSPASIADTRARMGFAPSDFVVGTSGRLVEGKDPWTLCRAFERLLPGRPELKLVFIGGGPLQPALQAWAQSKGLARRIHITGFLPPHEVPAHLHALDLFAFPSLREGSPLALAEAMACALPCVCADFPAASETMDHGTHGLIAPRQDDAAWVKAMAQLMGDAPQRATLGAAARQRAEENFSATAMATRMASLYREMLG
jgi:glycosyltransferase involved in cell wall biosynthesis